MVDDDDYCVATEGTHAYLRLARSISKSTILCSVLADEASEMTDILEDEEDEPSPDAAIPPSDHIRPHLSLEGMRQSANTLQHLIVLLGSVVGQRKNKPPSIPQSILSLSEVRPEYKVNKVTFLDRCRVLCTALSNVVNVKDNAACYSALLLPPRVSQPAVLPVHSRLTVISIVERTGCLRHPALCRADRRNSGS